jgi:hypothetical protein
MPKAHAIFTSLGRKHKRQRGRPPLARNQSARKQLKNDADTWLNSECELSIKKLVRLL